MAALCLILYFNALGNVFIFDDLHGIEDNLYIKNPRYIPLFFQGFYTSIPEIPKGMFRPLLLLTFSFNYFFSGLQPLGYHIINILLHFLNGILLYLILKFLNNGLRFGILLSVCLLFIAHPINSETVTYISCRSDLLVTFLILSAFYAFIKNRIFLSVLLYIFALLTKETALVYSLLPAAYLIFHGTAIQERHEKNKFIFYFGGLIMLAAIYWIYRSAILNMGIKDSFLPPKASLIRGGLSNACLQSVISLFYLRLFIWPHPLTIHHYFSNNYSFFQPIVFTSLVIIGLIFIIILWVRKKYPLISLGLAWYFICLLPKFYGALRFPAMEHHFYLPSIGIYILLSSVLKKYYERRRSYFLLLGAGILGIFTILVWFRNYEWKDSLTLYKLTVKNNPDSVFARNNLGVEYSRLGLNKEAETEYKKALSLSKSALSNVNCRINLSKIYAGRKMFPEALNELNQAVKIKPDYSIIYHAYGVVYSQMGEKEKAEEILKKGLEFNPRSSGILDNLGILYIKKEMFKEAKECFLAAIDYSPDDYLAHFYLGGLFENAEDNAQAMRHYKKSVSLNPAHALSHSAIGRLYAKGLNPRAFYHLKEALRLQPSLTEAQNNLAVLYASMEPPKLDLAKKHALNALSWGYPVEKAFLKLIGIEGEGGEVKN